MVESGPFIEYCSVGYVKVAAVLPVLALIAAAAFLIGFLLGRLKPRV